MCVLLATDKHKRYTHAQTTINQRSHLCMSDVFISYSRRNKEFARKLVNRLTETGRTAWVDWEGIPLTASNWWQEIQNGIEKADNFVFILSPDSFSSVVCHMELNYALTINKRVIIVVYQAIDADEAFATLAEFKPDAAMRERLNNEEVSAMAQHNWQRISHINWDFFREEDDFESNFNELIAAVETDLEHVRDHTRYFVRAREWLERDERIDLLLYGDEIRLAENWLHSADAKDKKPKPDAVHRRYILASRRAEHHRQRIRQSVGVAVAALLILVLVAGWFSVNATNEANASRTQVALAGQTLTPIPITLNAAAAQVNTASAAQQQAEARVADSSTQVAVAQSTLTPAAAAIMTSEAVQQAVRRERAESEYAYGNLIYYRGLPGEFGDAQFAYENALQLFQELGDTQRVADTLLGLASLTLFFDAENPEIEDYLSQALALFTEIEDDLGQANTREVLGDLAFANDELDEARAYFEEALVLYKQVENPIGQASTLQGLGQLAFANDELDEARAYFEEALVLQQQYEDFIGQANTYSSLGELALVEQELDTAQMYFQEAEILYTSMNDLVSLLSVVDGQARAARQSGDLDTACATYQRLFDLGEGLDDDRFAFWYGSAASMGCGITITEAVMGENVGVVPLGDIQVWAYAGQAGEVVTLDTIADWDTTLDVRGSLGEQIAFNDDDDDLPNHNSRIAALVLPDDGEITIIVGSYNYESGGSYSLVIKPG
ncbi:MAG: hypothetical protein OHK0046_01920 [Anaerolineae bacterium]